MSWKDTQKELGIPDTEISRRVRERIEEYNDTFTALANARKKVKTATGDEKEELEQNIETMEKGLLIYDKQLTNDMQRLKKNGARYKELSKNLKKSGKAKAPNMTATPPVAEPAVNTAAQGGPTTPPPVPEPAKEPPKPEPKTQEPPAAPKPPTPPGAPKPTAKKKDNTVAWLVGGLITAAGLFLGYRWWNNRNS